MNRRASMLRLLIIPLIIAILIWINMAGKELVLEACSPHNPEWQKTNLTATLRYLDFEGVHECFAPDFRPLSNKYQCALTCDGNYFYDEGMFGADTCVCGGKQ